jgi:glycosyltransferase involved in cell wall biosynthesis
VKSVATLHDTILFYYARQHPGFFPRTKLAYFLAMTRWTLRRADRIVTGTQDSARALSALCPAAASRITLMAPGGVEDAVPAAAAAARKGVLVIGSRLPHKATAETLRLLAGYARRRATRLAVQVSGLDDGNGVTAAADAQALDLTFHGRVDNATMRSLMQGVRALVFLSRIEGFGLPLLEAYSAGTPVCYRNRSAMRDVMAGAPGGWDGRSAESFDAALDEALNLPPDRVAAVRASLRERYRWDDIAQRMLTVYREVLDDRP